MASKDEWTNSPFIVNDISKPDQKYYLEDRCVTEILIANNSNSEIYVKEFSFVVSDIKLNTEPCYILYDYVVDVGTKNMVFAIYNDGWVDQTNISIKMTDKNGILYQYIPEEKLEWKIEELKEDDTAFIKFPEELFSYFPERTVEINPVFEVISDGGAVIEECPCVIFLNNKGIEDEGSGMGSSSTAVGLMIDSNKSEDTISFAVSENIKGGCILELPICFFADRSCSFQICIEIVVFDGEKEYSIYTEPRDIELMISHYSTYWNYDGKYIEDNYECLDEDTLISYPYDREIYE